MLPSGWLKKHIDRRLNSFETGQIHIARHHDMSLYNVLQPTGLMYGTPVEEGLGEGESLEQLLLDSLLNSYLVFKESEASNEDGYRESVRKAIPVINKFYAEIFPEYTVAERSFWGKKKLPLEITEKTIQNRIYDRPENGHNFWTHIFNNALIFLDIYLFSQWIHMKADKIVTDFFRQEKEELRLIVIKILASAAHANHIIEMSERKFLDVLLHSAELSRERERKAMQYMIDGIEVEEIELPQNNSWLLKKFYLEIAILMVWADREIDKNEWQFLKRLSTHLGFFADDLDKSMIAIEGFLLSNWAAVSFNEKQSASNITQKYLEKIAFLAKRNAVKIDEQVAKNEALQRLITRFHEANSTEEDDQRLREWLTDILQSLPSLKSILLPRSVFTLPVLMQVMPESISAKG